MLKETMTNLDVMPAEDSAKQAHEKQLVAAASVAAAVILVGAKLAVGVITGSLGILAEAVHSALDMAAAFITLLAVRISERPADASHLYGHGKVENLSALVETLLLMATCAWIIYEAIKRLFFVPVLVEPNLGAFLLMGLSMVIDYSRSRSLSRVARKYQSQALEADALHFKTDIWSSAVVILGLVLVKIGEIQPGNRELLQRADAVAALVVAFIIICAGARLGSRTVDALLDRAPQGLAEQLEEKIKAIPGILKVARIRFRNVGNRLFVDLIVEVPRHFSFQESHRLAQEAQEAVRRIWPRADVLVHTNPIAEDETMTEIIQAVAAQQQMAIHNVTTHRTERGVWIDLDLEVDPGVSFEQAHQQATELENKLKAELIAGQPSVCIAGINVHIEPRAEEAVEGSALEPTKADLYIHCVNQICQDLGLAGLCHDIELHKVGGKIYLSLHLSLAADLSMAEAHGVAEQIEGRLRREFPCLGRIVIHTEPQLAGSE